MTASDEPPLDFVPDDPSFDEPPIREFADRGVLWLLESKENLRSLVRLLSSEIADKLNFSQAERANRSFIPDDLHKQESDLLYKVPFLSGGGRKAVWIYILLEHQSRPDRAMGLRLLSYMVKLWEMQRRAWEDAKLPASKWRLHPILPIVFYTGKRRWTSPISVKSLMSLPDILDRFVPDFDSLFLPLQSIPAERLTGSAVAAALRTLQVADAPQEELARVLREVVTYLETLPAEAKPEWRRALQYLFLLVHHKREPEEQEELNQMMIDLMTVDREETSKMAMTSAQVLIAKGHKEGLKEGRQEGKIEGQLLLLMAQLEQKFGPLSENKVAALQSLPEARLTQIALQLLNAQSLSDLTF